MNTGNVLTYLSKWAKSRVARGRSVQITSTLIVQWKKRKERKEGEGEEKGGRSIVIFRELVVRVS